MFVLEVGIERDALLVLLEVELEPVSFVIEVGIVLDEFAVLP